MSRLPPSDPLPLASWLLARLAVQLLLLGDVGQQRLMIGVDRLAMPPGELARVMVIHVLLDAAEVRVLIPAPLAEAARKRITP